MTEIIIAIIEIACWIPSSALIRIIDILFDILLTIRCKFFSFSFSGDKAIKLFVTLFS